MPLISAILRDTSLLLIPAIGGGLWFGGAWLAAGVAITGVMVLGNIWLYGRLIPRLSGWFAGQDPGGSVAGVMLVAKLPVLLAIASGIGLWFGAEAIMFGFAAFVAAVFLRGLVVAIAPPPDPQNVSTQGS